MSPLKENDKSLVGMVHIRALPGTPRNNLTITEIIRIAVEEAATLREAGFDAIQVENMHVLPYLKRRVGPEITSSMTAITARVVQSLDCPVGVQILAGANLAAMAVALAAGATFIRSEGLVFAHVADEGVMEADAGELLRYRKAIGAEKIRIFADIKKKHSSHAITSDLSLSETAQAAEFFGASGLVVTGTATGKPTSRVDLEEARSGTALPILVGSGTTPENMKELWEAADGFIIGSYIKQGGRWDNPLDPGRIKKIVTAAEKLRQG